MRGQGVFISHPEVVIDPAVPVPRWHLAPEGIARMRRLAAEPGLDGLSAVWASDETKAIEGPVRFPGSGATLRGRRTTRCRSLSIRPDASHRARSAERDRARTAYRRQRASAGREAKAGGCPPPGA